MENKTYIHVETGGKDTRQGWIESYDSEELEERGLTASEAFEQDLDVTLIEVENKSVKTEKSNSIINSLKRLERVGSETSIATKKLKTAVEEVASKIFKIVEPFKNQFNVFDEFEFTKITKDLYLFENSANVVIVYDTDGKLDEITVGYDRYEIENSNIMTRECALSFAKAVSEGLLDEVAEWVESKKVAVEKGLKQITTATMKDVEGRR